MIFTHFSKSTLLSHLKTFDLLINSNCKNLDNVKHFKEECLRELERRFPEECCQKSKN